VYIRADDGLEKSSAWRPGSVPSNWRIVFRFEGNDAFDVELMETGETGDRRDVFWSLIR
jgi:hypothetical protein